MMGFNILAANMPRFLQDSREAAKKMAHRYNGVCKEMAAGYLGIGCWQNQSTHAAEKMKDESS
jgi:hypothetical protein